MKNNKYISNNGDNKNLIFRWLNMEDLEKSSFNPPSRTNAKSLVNLKKSIDKRGVKNPIQVIPIEKNKFRIIDGHRRFEISQALKRDSIPAIINEKEEDPNQLFIELNTNSKKLNGRQWLEIIKNGGIDAVPEKPKADYLYLAKLSGNEELFDVLLSKRTSISTVYSLLTNMSNHLERESRPEKRKILNYILSMDKVTVLRETFKQMRKPILWELIEESK